MRKACIALAMGALILLAGCGGTKFSAVAAPGDDALYAALYPYYAEMCAVSQLKKKPGFGAPVYSGIGGHAVLYLNGVCRDADSHYPVIAMCDPSAPGEGVGLSVNAHYRNANWVATPGHDFFFHGTLAANQRLTRAAYRETQARAEQLGILDGVEFHEDVFKDQPAGMSRRDFKYDMSVATDYAIAFGRDRYCARVPLGRARMAKVVDYLNGLNAPYRSGEKIFEWNVLTNNCSHVNHNALMTAGVWSEWKTDRFIVLAALDFPVPKNEFVNLMRRMNDMPLDDARALYEDRAARRSLMTENYLPMAPGGLVESEPAIHANDVYDTDLSLIFYDDPVFGSYQKHFDEIVAEPRYSDIRANLRYFAQLYARIEAARKPPGGTDGEASDDPGFQAFDRRYYAYIAHERVEAGTKLASLAGLYR